MASLWQRFKNFLKRFWPLTIHHFDRKSKQQAKKIQQGILHHFDRKSKQQTEKLQEEILYHFDQKIEQEMERRQKEVLHHFDQKIGQEMERLRKEIIPHFDEQIKKEIQETKKTQNKLNAIENHIVHYVPKAELSFEVALAEHCNLNCAGCNHFSCLAEPELADYEELARDFARLSALSNGRAKRIYLLGGEPLLHPEIIKILAMARENFPDSRILILTNGVLLLNQPEEFWQACKENRIVIQMTKYPIPLDYEEIEKRAAEHGVESCYINNTAVVKTTSLYRLDLNGMQNGSKNFLICPWSNNCIYLQHGRLYTCVIAPTARHFSRFFGVNLKEYPEDSIDIYQAESLREIMEFLARPIPFCRYCMPDKARRNFPWRQTERSIEEWT